jgi:hypothetical protein
MAATRCPYCFELLDKRVQAFRCVNPNASACPAQEDVRLGKYQALAPPRLQRVIEHRVKWFRAHSVVCTCGMQTSMQICPECHNELPAQFDTCRNSTIALIGPTFVGKSHYVAVLINELLTRVGSDFNASLTALDDQTLRRYEQNFHRPLFDQQTLIDKTRSAGAVIENKYPFVYKWAAANGRRFQKSCALVFFDAAGEDLDEIDKMSAQAKYIAWADGIIFLFDPLQIPQVRDRLTQLTAVPPVVTDPEVVLRSAAELIRSVQQKSPVRKINLPIAFTFSKIDAIRELLDDGSPLNRASKHAGVFDLKEQRQVHDSMRAYLNEWLGAELTRYIDRNFSNYSYFGVSALGREPDPDGSVWSIAPFRVEDPLLWLLHKNGLVKAR